MRALLGVVDEGTCGRCERPLLRVAVLRRRDQSHRGETDHALYETLGRGCRILSGRGGRAGDSAQETAMAYLLTLVRPRRPRRRQRAVRRTERPPGSLPLCITTKTTAFDSRTPIGQDRPRDSGNAARSARHPDPVAVDHASIRRSCRRWRAPRVHINDIFRDPSWRKTTPTALRVSVG